MNLHVEIDGRLPGDPFSPPAATAWKRIDNTNALRELDVNRGARVAHGKIEPAEGFLVFTNDNGFLDPSYPATPHAGLLTSGRQIRVVHVLADGTKDPVFTGMVKKWPVTYSEAGLDPTAVVEITDVKWHLGATQAPESVVLHEMKRGVRLPRPDHCFMFRENEGTSDVSYSDDINDFEAVPKGVPKRGSGLMPFTNVSGFESGRLAEAGGFVEIPINAWPAPPWTFAILMRIAPDTSAWVLADSDPRKLRLWVTDSTATPIYHLEGRVVKTDGVVAATDKVFKRPGDDEPHLVVFNNTGTRLQIWLDGSSVGSIDYSPGAQMPTGVIRIGSAGRAQYAMATIWSQLLTGTQRSDLQSDIFNPWFNEDIGARVRRLLDLSYPGVPMGLDTTVSSRHTDVVQALPAKLNNQPLLDIIERMVEGADARFWVPRGGGLQFRWRGLAWLNDAATKNFPYPKPGKLYGVGGVPTIDYHVTDGDDDLVTAAFIENEAGARGYFEDEAASRDHGQRRFELSNVGNRFPSSLALRAEREVYYRGKVRSYVDWFELQVGAGVDPLDVLKLDIYDRVDHARTRPYDGVVVTDKLDVIGVRHQASGAGFLNWRTTVRTQPARRARHRLVAGGTSTTAFRGANTPHQAKWNLNNGLDIRVCIRKGSADRWADPAARALAARRATISDATWMLFLERGKLGFLWHPQPVGSARRITIAPVAHVKRSGPIPVWFRARLDPLVARVDLFTSLDGKTWTAVHSETTAATTGVVATTNELAVAYAESNSFPLDGDVMMMELRDLAGNLVGGMDPNLTDEVGFHNPISWVAATGETWTKRTDSGIEPW